MGAVMMLDGEDGTSRQRSSRAPVMLSEGDPGSSWLSWSREAKLASQLWFTVDSANRFVLLKRWGLEETCAIEFNFLRKHQETHFVDGCRKLGLLDDPAVIRCAKYHVLSNVLGGLDQGYQEESGRAWVFYMPPMSMAESALSPCCGAINVPKEIWLTGFRAWHANNGALLGNDRLYFTVTDLISEGGPYDGGFFAEADRALRPEERLQIRLGQFRGRPGPIPRLGPMLWPQGRRDAALKKYSAQYAIGGAAQIAEIKGMDEAVSVFEESVRQIFLSWARPLLAELGIREARSTMRVARLFQSCFALLGDQIDLVDEGRDVLLLHRSSRLSAPQYPGWERPPIEIEGAFARAWSVISRAIGDEVTVSVDGSRAQGAPHTTWRFR
jgi:hypothetical protein